MGRRPRDKGVYEMAEEVKTMRRAYKFRAYPNVGTRRQLWNIMRRAATPVWNACVAEREHARQEYATKLDMEMSDFAWEHRRDLTEAEEKTIRRQVSTQIAWPSDYSQYKHVRKRDHPEYAPYSSSMLQCTVAKVDGSEKSFRALWLKGDRRARPPKQKHIVQCLTFRKSGYEYTPPEAGSRTGYLRLFGITDPIKIRAHRDTQGKIKAVSITQENGKWYVCLSCEITNFHGSCGPVPAPKSLVRRDLQEKYTPSGGADPERGGTHNLGDQARVCTYGGADPERGGTHNKVSHCSAGTLGGADLETIKGESVTLYFPGDVFMADSTGRIVEHPEFYGREIEVLRRLSRSLSRKHPAHPGMKGQRKGDFRGRNRLKAKRRLADWHEHIAAKRAYFLWAWARYYAANFREIIVPKWPLKQEIQYAMESKTARKLCDGAYGMFIKMLKQKSQEFGSKVIEATSEAAWREGMKRFAAVGTAERINKLHRKLNKYMKCGNRDAARIVIEQMEQLKQEVT